MYRVEYRGWVDDFEWEDELSVIELSVIEMEKYTDINQLCTALHGSVTKIIDLETGEQIYS